MENAAHGPAPPPASARQLLFHLFNRRFSLHARHQRRRDKGRQPARFPPPHRPGASCRASLDHPSRRLRPGDAAPARQQARLEALGAGCGHGAHGTGARAERSAGAWRRGMEERDDVGEGRMGQTRMGRGVVGLKRCLFRRGEQELDRQVCSPVKGETSPGYVGHGDRRLCILVGRVLLLYSQHVKVHREREGEGGRKRGVTALRKTIFISCGAEMALRLCSPGFQSNLSI